MQRYRIQIWNITFGCSLILLFLTYSTAQNVYPTDARFAAKVTPSKGVQTTIEVEIKTSSHSSPLKSDLQNEDNAPSVNNSNAIVLNPRISHDLNSVNVTADSGQTTTQVTGTTSEENNGDLPPKFNYAIIAAIGGLVLVTVLCIQCCTWFRSYTRGGDKEESTTKYAAILHTGDEEYGHIDLQSDTASTVYLDTISSYQSFLKRNGTDNSVPSSKFGFSRQNSSSPRKENGRPLCREVDTKYTEMKPMRSVSRAETPDTCSPRSESAMSDNVRTFSVSSEDTDPSSLPPSSSNDDDVNSKRSTRSKVSFTTETSTTMSNINRLERQRSFNRAALKCSPVERHKRSFSCRNSQRLSESHDSTFRLKPIQTVVRSEVAGTSVHVATQTNRSFTYSRWKSRKRHHSDSGVDDMVGPPTIHELASSRNNYTDNCGHTVVPVSTEFPVTTCNPLTIPSEIPNRTSIPALIAKHGVRGITHALIEETPKDINEESDPCVNDNGMAGTVPNREPSVSDSESNDDVFATDGPTATGMEADDKKDASDNNNSCTCVSREDGGRPDCSHEMCDKKNSPHAIQLTYPSLNCHKDYNCDGCGCVVNFNHCDTIYDTSGKDIDKGLGSHLPYCEICQQRQTLITDRKPRCRTGTTCDMFLINELGTSDHDSCDVYERRSSLDNDTLSAVLKHLNSDDVNDKNGGTDMLHSAVTDVRALCVEPNVTSSITSTESSGYAEISSEALTA